MKFHIKNEILKITVKVTIFILFSIMSITPLYGLIIWSFAEKWMWPALFPQRIGFKYWSIILNESFSKAIANSILIALTVTFICICLSLPLSYIIARFKFKMRNWLLLLFLLPQAFPQLPVFTNTTTILYKLNLGGRFLGVVLIHLLGGFIYCIWTLTAVFQSIPKSLEEAAINIGDSFTKVFLKITLPCALPGIVASSILVFLWSLDEFTGAILVGSPFVITLPVFLYQSSQGYELQVASVTSLLLTVPGVILLLLLEKYLKAEYISKFGS